MARTKRVGRCRLAPLSLWLVIGILARPVAVTVPVVAAMAPVAVAVATAPVAVAVAVAVLVMAVEAISKTEMTTGSMMAVECHFDTALFRAWSACPEAIVSGRSTTMAT